jgi:hypothetical protein
VPSAPDTVTITGTHSVRVNIPGAACAGVSLVPAKNNSTVVLSFASNATLTVQGGVTVGGSGSKRGKLDMTAGGTLAAGSLVLVNAGSVWAPGAGTVELTGNNTLPSSVFTTFNHLVLRGGATTMPVPASVSGLLSIGPSGNASASVGSGVTVSVNRLSLGGLGKSSGTWGSSLSAAEHVSDAFFAATSGLISVVADTRPAGVVMLWPSAGGIVYGQPLSDSVLSGGQASVPGAFTFVDASLVPVVGTSAQAVAFTPEDPGTYRGVIGSIPVTVSPPPEPAGLVLAWDPSDSTNVAGYILYRGDASGAYAVSNVFPGSVTGTTVSGLATGVHFFAVTAYAGDGTESEFSNELIVTNTGVALLAAPAAPATLQSADVQAMAIEPALTAPVAPSADLQATVPGIPSRLALALEPDPIRLEIQGTVGADMQVQVSTNLVDPLAWRTVATLTLGQPAPAGEGAAAAPDLLATAFVPALETLVPPAPPDGAAVFYRLMMPYSYAALAAKVLQGKGYETWLVAVRLVGETLHDVCYVSPEQAYIACNEVTFVMALNHADPTLRAIADDFGNSVSMNWTSASTFILTNGARQLTSTVVKTDDPSADVTLTANLTSPILINF